MNKDKITARFGADFYVKVLGGLEKYAALWGLSDFDQIDYYSVNCIFKCVSNKHGACVLKIGSDADTIKKEYRILREYNGNRFCKAYEADIQNSALLIEQITPGTQLWGQPDIDKRLDIFCKLVRGLHIKPTDRTAYPTYMKRVRHITEYMRSRKEHETLYAKMVKAEQICRELCEKYTGEMLLHGDLHQENILLGSNNRYHIIDPHGVIGDVVFEIPRFILNEFRDNSDDKFHAKFAHIIRTFSENLSIPEHDIRRLTYVETCMDSCWDVEDKKEPNMENVLFAEKMMG
jgi:streptomycin 6-kinase